MEVWSSVNLHVITNHHDIVLNYLSCKAQPPNRFSRRSVVTARLVGDIYPWCFLSSGFVFLSWPPGETPEPMSVIFLSKWHSCARIKSLLRSQFFLIISIRAEFSPYNPCLDSECRLHDQVYTPKTLKQSEIDKKVPCKSRSENWLMTLFSF